MLLLVVWIAVVVLALLVAGVLGYSLRGAAGRLAGELRALDNELRPVLTNVQATLERAAARRAHTR